MKKPEFKPKESLTLQVFTGLFVIALAVTVVCGPGVVFGKWGFVNFGLADEPYLAAFLRICLGYVSIFAGIGLFFGAKAVGKDLLEEVL